MLRSYLVNTYVMGPTGLGSPFIDGVSLDDGWYDSQQIGANDCTGSPVGGPTEVDSFCAIDMNLTQVGLWLLLFGVDGLLAATCIF